MNFLFVIFSFYDILNGNCTNNFSKRRILVRFLKQSEHQIAMRCRRRVEGLSEVWKQYKNPVVGNEKLRLSVLKFFQ